MQLRNRKETKAGAQGARWRRLDNTGKLFAAVAGEDLSNVFRISAVLKEEIRPELLEEALNMTLLEFEDFRVKLRKGFFWCYFETNNRQPLVEREEGFPCRYIDPHGSRRFLFRVSYYEKRINFEVFHGLTDGLGALQFMKVLTEHYLELSMGERQPGREESTEKSLLSTGSRAMSQETDGYLKNYKKRSGQRYTSGKALPIKGACMPLNGQSVIHGTLELSRLKEKSHSCGVSITVYLAAVLIWSLIRIYGNGEELKYPAALNLPVNLRTIFDTETQANFFSITNVGWPAGKTPERFEDVLLAVSRQLKEQTVKERLEEVISYNVSNEKKWYVRITPSVYEAYGTGSAVSQKQPGTFHDIFQFRTGGTAAGAVRKGGGISPFHRCVPQTADQMRGCGLRGKCQHYLHQRDGGQPPLRLFLWIFGKTGTAGAPGEQRCSQAGSGSGNVSASGV